MQQRHLNVVVNYEVTLMWNNIQKRT